MKNILDIRAEKQVPTSTTTVQQIPPYVVVLVLTGLMLFCTYLSLAFFSGQSLRLDESQSLWQSAHSPLGIIKIVAEDVHVPLYNELLHAWRIVFGSSVSTVRALSFVFYLISIPTLYMLASAVYSQRVGLFASFLLAFSPFLNWYGNEVRMYSLFLFLTILNQYFFVMLMRDTKRSIWIGYTLTAITGVYTHYFFVCNFVGQIIFYGLRRKEFKTQSIRPFVLVAFVTAVTFIPWVWYVLHIGRAVNQEPLLVTPTTVDLFNAFAQFFFGFQTDRINTVLLSLWPLGIPAVFLTLKNTFTMEKETEYFLLSIIVTFVLAFGTSLLIEPIFISRYLIFTTPALFLFTANIAVRYIPTILRVALLATMVLMLGIQITSTQTPVKENYRDAVTYINEHARPSDIVVVSAPFTIYPVEYYYDGLAPLVTLPRWNQYATGPIPPYSDAEMQAQIADLAQSYQTGWIILSYDQGFESNIRMYLDTHYQRLFTKEFSPKLTVYQYQFRYDTPLSAATSTSP